jgi:uncharacterized protein YxeA
MKKVIWVVFIISILAIASMFLFRSSNISRREHHIFCETLALGMNSDDVLNSLKEFGDINYSTPLPSEEGYDEIAVGYIDSQVVGRNTYILSFQDGKYTGVSVTASFWEFKGIGSVNSVCSP